MIRSGRQTAASRHAARHRPARTAWRRAGLALLTLSVLAGCREPEPPPARHLVLVTLDTVRADRLGSYGYPRGTTPNLDALAARGARFEAAVAQAISTPPSHASILTGLDPAQHGLRRLSSERLNPDNVTLAERLQDAGFTTAAFVSGLPLRRALGLDQGFAVYDDEVDESGERTAGATNERVRAWLAGLPDDPERRVFLWVHYFDAHAPYWAPPEFRARFHPHPVRREDLAQRVVANERGRPGVRVRDEVVARMSDLYDAEIAYVDDQVGALFAMLRARGVLDDAVVAVVADHGECFGEQGYYFAHFDVWWATAHVPMLLAHPDGRWAGTVVPALVRTTDLLPTALRWLGLPAPRDVAGRDLTPLIAGGDEAPRTAYTEQLEYFPARALRESAWLLAQHDFDDAAGRPGTLAFYGRDADGRERPVLAEPRGVRERLAAALRDAVAPRRAFASLPLEVEADVAEQLRALGYVVDDPAGAAGERPAE